MKNTSFLAILLFIVSLFLFVSFYEPARPSCLTGHAVEEFMNNLIPLLFLIWSFVIFYFVLSDFYNSYIKKKSKK
jgi:hypothetical protein